MVMMMGCVLTTAVNGINLWNLFNNLSIMNSADAFKSESNEDKL